MNKPQRRTLARLWLAAHATFLPALAQAQEAAPLGGAEGAPSVAGTLMNFVPYAVMFFAVYILLLRPAKKQRLEQQELLNGLKKDDEVLTQSGIVGRIVALEETLVVLEVADKVKVRMLRDRITGLYAGKAAAAVARGGN